jgi:hypothetical protein
MSRTMSRRVSNPKGLRRERWVFTLPELEHPERCSRGDVFLAWVDTEGDGKDETDVQVDRRGRVSNTWGDGTCGVTAPVRALAADVEEYTIPISTYDDGTERGGMAEAGEYADQWRDVVTDSEGRFVRFADKSRPERLAPGGVPRWIRCYDNGGETADRYTVVYSGKAAVERSEHHTEYPYRGMSSDPFHPQGFGQSGATPNQPCDTLGKKPGWHWPPAVGRKNHLGKRITWHDLPHDCQRLVWRDYAEIWKLKVPSYYSEPAPE